MRNIMCDLETLGTRPGSSILSIGAVEFDPQTGTIDDEFYVVIDLDSCRMNGLREEPDTRDWWDRQSGEARVALMQAETGQGKMLDVALNMFAEWLLGEDDLPFLIWGNGAAFDVPILEAAYVRVGQSIPWDFRHVCCYRTLRRLAVLPASEVPADEAVAHHALNDARWQAKYAIKALALVSTSIHHNEGAEHGS